MKSKKTIIAVVAGVVFLSIVFVAVLLSKSFDASGYVSVVLNQTFYGKVEGAAEIIDGVTEEELYQTYEDGVTAFVKNNVISGVDMDAETEAKFIELGKKIFAAMKFEILEAEKISRKEYNVMVKYEPSDVFVEYVNSIKEENKRISDKVQSGAYKGSADEINEQIKKEFIGAAYSLLEDAYNDMTYGEAQEMEFVVKVGATELYQMREDEVQKFLVKIMRLDEITD